MSSVQDLRNTLSGTVSFLRPYTALMEAHTVEFLTGSLYDRLLPSSFRDEIGRMGGKRVADLFFKHCQGSIVEEHTEIGRFFNSIHDVQAANRSVDFYSLAAFRDLLHEEGCRKHDTIPLEGFMNGKKVHEVSRMSPLVAELYETSRCQAVVDIGDGKGYLSSFLAFEYGLKVLGVDSSSVKTQGAAKRSRKLRRIWKGARGKKTSSCEKGGGEGVTSVEPVSDYHRVTRFVDVSTDLSEMVTAELGEGFSRFGLAGLHTCGDLGPACLRLFVNNPDTGFLVNVSCCYNLLTDSFPLSAFLKDSHFVLSRNARMLSLKPKRKIGLQQHFGTEALEYRAVLQDLLLDRMKLEPSEDLTVGKIGPKSPSFVHYAKTAFNRLRLENKMSDEELECYYDERKDKVELLNSYMMILTSLSSLVEDTILLDRLLFLKEQGIERSYMVEMFDATVSPRCFGLIALRNLL